MPHNFRKDFKRLYIQKEEHPVLHSFMKWILIILAILLVILLILFVIIFIVFPIVFMLSLALERLLLFMNVNVPKNPKFDMPHEYGFQGVTNFYITSRASVNSSEVLSIGAWWLPNEKYLNSTERMDDILKKDEFPVVLYNHGVLATRILKYDYIYKTLRKYFHVISIDYRDYGDSSPHDLSEEGVVLDVVHTYNLVKSKTKADIYVWGHSLGGGISAHAVKWLKDNEEEIPAGFVIESSFTSLQEELYEYFISKIFKWLPWFELCVVDPVREHGFIFNTTRNVQDIDCPIMIMHAEDDPVIPFFLGERNFNITSQNRKPSQGQVFFHPFAAKKGYGHVGCTQDPEVPKYIEEFMSECEKWKNERARLQKKLNGTISGRV
ncbi:lysophosphatidylserine lipase ABHD12-like [Coccinella septempunctata]|uniref:lysophosphatidylserine lipase ABHD12-like n=1 Tax=Coccinella septempunctata TaxID=41139 RepID=UPI001D07CE59|nr:lysophosphatidylserine lipase ABHD12-like [Coccinella septempunctata]